MTLGLKGAIEQERLQQERDLLLRLLELSHTEAIEPLLKDALDLAVKVTGAQRGHIHVFSPDGHGDQWSMVLNCGESDAEELRARISKGIEAEVLRERRLIHTVSAHLDPRFSKFESVRGIEGVLCAPLGQDNPVGVLYLYGSVQRGPFMDDDIRLVELLSKHLAPAVHWLATKERQKLRQDATALWRSRLRVASLVGSSEAMASTFEFIAAVAPLKVGVLLTGDSGTGKSAIARAIHDNGPWSGEAFVELNCAALPSELVEAELFGTTAGAFTGAINRPGKIQAAEHGTLFLDEIGELPPAAQSKLLSFLESKSYSPVGGIEIIHSDVRVISATNLDLAEEVSARRFREDLFHRLNVVPFRVPSLAERSEDIEELAHYFRNQSAQRNRLPKLPISDAARIALRTWTWTGNVRELANTVEAALIRATTKGEHEISLRHLFPSQGNSQPSITYQNAMRNFQQQLIRNALKKNDWNVTAAAKQLDITRSHVYKLMATFGLKNPAR